MPFGLASYFGGVDVINTAEPLSIFYLVRITDLKAGTVTITLPTEASNSDVIPFVGPSSRNTDETISMGGTTGAKGKITAISIVGRTVNVTVAPISYGPAIIQIAFFNAKGLPCLASN